MGAKHDGLLILLTILVFIFSVLTFFGVGTYVAITDENGGFEAILDKYTTKLSPPAWSYYIWFLVGIWQVAWILYVLTTICRYTDTGPMYRQPPVISKLFMWGYLVALLLNGVALLFLVNDFLLLFVIFMLLLWFTLALTMVYLHVRMDEYFVLMGLKFRRDLLMLVVGVQNGVALHAAFVTAVILTSLCPLAIGYIPTASPSDSVIASVAVLLFLMTLYFLLDVTILDRYTRFTFSVYPLVFWVLICVVYHQWHPRHWVVNPLILVAALVVLLMLMVKIAVISGRKYKNAKQRDVENYNVNVELTGIASHSNGRGNNNRGEMDSPREVTSLVRETPAHEEPVPRMTPSPLLEPSQDKETPNEVAAPYDAITPTEQRPSVRESPYEGASPGVDITSHDKVPLEGIPEEEIPSEMFTSNVTIMKDVFLTKALEITPKYQSYEYSLYIGEEDDLRLGSIDAIN